MAPNRPSIDALRHTRTATSASRRCLPSEKHLTPDLLPHIEPLLDDPNEFVQRAAYNYYGRLAISRSFPGSDVVQSSRLDPASGSLRRRGLPDWSPVADVMEVRHRVLLRAADAPQLVVRIKRGVLDRGAGSHRACP